MSRRKRLNGGGRTKRRAVSAESSRRRQGYGGQVASGQREKRREEIYDCYKKVYSPLRVIKYLLFGQKGFRLIILGIALLRYLEGLKNKKYVRDSLSSRNGIILLIN